MKIVEARDYVVNNLKYALDPKSIAVVGASRYPTKVGYKVVYELMKWGFKGNIYPVNPRADQILGLKCYHTLKEINQSVDLVFVAVPAHLVTQIVNDAIAIKAKVLVVATSAFKEIGRQKLQDDIVNTCRKAKLPFIGPNLVGLGSPYHHFSQADHFGMSFFVGLGNKADVDFSEFIEYAGQDENTKCLAIYIEGLDSPEAFISSCKKVDKPIVVIKVGGSKIGVKAAFAHTASENPNGDEYYDKVIKDAGAIRVQTWQEFLDVSLALGYMPPLKGDNVVMITNGGGAGLLSCDHFERLGMPLNELKDISPMLAQRIRAYMPMFGSPLNPVDISGTATVIQYKGAFQQALRDPNVHGVLGAICPTAVTDVIGVAKAAIEVYESTKELNKPFIMICQGGEECHEAIKLLREHDIPAYPTAEQAVNAMVALYKYGKSKK